LHGLRLWGARLRFGLRCGALLALEVSPHRRVRRAERTSGTGGRGFFFRWSWSLGQYRLGFLPRRFFFGPSGPGPFGAARHLPRNWGGKGHLPTRGEDKFWFWLFGPSLRLRLDLCRHWFWFFGPSGPGPFGAARHLPMNWGGKGHLPTSGEDKLGLGQVGECLRFDDRRFGRDRLGDLRLDDLGFKKQAGRLLGLHDRGLRLGHLGGGRELRLRLGLRLARRRCLFHDLRLCNLLGFRQRLHLVKQRHVDAGVDAADSLRPLA
jgi:hypothetical protein